MLDNWLYMFGSQIIHMLLLESLSCSISWILIAFENRNKGYLEKREESIFLIIHFLFQSIDPN